MPGEDRGHVKGSRESRTTVTDDGVSVERVVTPKPEGFVARYRITTATDSRVVVRITDGFPDEFTVEEAEFADQASPARGDLSERRALLEAVVPTDDEVEVVYGVRLEEGQPRFLGPPVVEEAYPLRAGDDATHAALSDREPDSAVDGDPATGSDAGRSNCDGGVPRPRRRDRERDTGGDEVAEEQPASERANTPADAPAVPGSEEPPDDGDRRPDSAAIADRLAAELRADQVEQDELAVLRDELGTDVSGRYEVKLDRLQSRVATFDAYIDAMEAFIDEYGTADEVLADVYSRFDEIQDEVTELTAAQSKAASERDQLTEILDAAHEEIADVRTDVDEVRADVGDVRSELDDVWASVTGIKSEVDEIQDDIQAVERDVDDVQNEVDSLTRRYEVLHDEVTSVEEATASIESEVESVRDEQETEFASVRSDIEELRTDLAELRSIMTSIRGVFTREELEDEKGSGLDV